MKLQPVALMCALFFSSSALALAPIEAEPFPHEATEELAAYTVKLDPEDRAGFAKFILAMPEDERGPLLTDWTDEKVLSVSLKDIMLLTGLPQARPLYAKLTHYDDAIVRFLALGMVIAGGDDKAAVQLHELARDPLIDERQARWVRTLFEVIGLDIKEDSPESISKHLKAMFGGEPLLKPGDPAPLFDVTDMHGARLNLEDMKGRVVVLHFWATWCGPCMGELPRLKTELDRLDPEVVVIGVSLDQDREALIETLKKHEMPWHNVFDGREWGSELGRLYGINGVPTNVIIDREGVIFSNKISDVSKLFYESEEPVESPGEPTAQP